LMAPAKAILAGVATACDGLRVRLHLERIEVPR